MRGGEEHARKLSGKTASLAKPLARYAVHLPRGG